MGDARPAAPGGFDFVPRTRVILGAGCVERLGELAAQRGVRRALVVSDAGVVAAGHAGRALAVLSAAGIETALFADVRENPTTADVDRCLAALFDARPDLLVAVGGGSSIDTAKGANFLYTNGGCMEDYWGRDKATVDLLPLFVVPTTAGTGSEVQSYALIAREEDHQKMACGDAKAAPAIALLDPALTATQPPRVAACTGLDALTHALETAVTRPRTAVSSLWARESFRLAFHALPRVLAGAADEAVRADMLLAAAWAGLAIEQSMLGVAHSLANPLTAHHGVPHGQAVASALPHVIRFNAGEPEAAREYASLARLVGLADAEVAAPEAAARLAAWVARQLDAAGFPVSLGAHGVQRGELEGLAQEAARQWTAQFNPRAAGVPELHGLYSAWMDA